LETGEFKWNSNKSEKGKVQSVKLAKVYDDGPAGWNLGFEVFVKEVCVGASFYFLGSLE
jgi:hypothetical protein